MQGGATNESGIPGIRHMIQQTSDYGPHVMNATTPFDDQNANQSARAEGGHLNVADHGSNVETSDDGYVRMMSRLYSVVSSCDSDCSSSLGSSVSLLDAQQRVCESFDEVFERPDNDRVWRKLSDAVDDVSRELSAASTSNGSREDLNEAGRPDGPYRTGLLDHLSGRSMFDHEQTSSGQVNQTSPFAPSMIKDRLIHLVARTRIGRVRDSVREHGGEIKFKFAQTKGDFLSQIMMHKDTAGGVCESLAAHWIASHARGGSLFDELYVDGKKGKFQIDTLYSIKELQIEGVTGDADQNKVSEAWLGKNEVRPMMRELKIGPTTYPRPMMDQGITGARGPEKLIDAILDKNGYKKIGLTGEMVGHTVAAHVDENGATFFDPNFGEFYFADKTSFRKWFSEAFWKDSMYHYEKLGLGKEFTVRGYEAAPDTTREVPQRTSVSVWQSHPLFRRGFPVVR